MQLLSFSPVLHQYKAFPPDLTSSLHTHSEIKESSNDVAVKSHAEEE